MQLFNMLGDGLLTVGLTLIVVNVSQSATALTLLLACSTAAGIVALLGSSIWLDAFNRRRTLIVIDVGRVIAAVLRVAYLVSEQTWLLVLIGITAGISVALYRPAFSAYIGDIAAPDDRHAANALRSTASKLSSIAGPALAGVLANVDAQMAIPILAGLLACVSIAGFTLGPPGMTPERHWRMSGFSTAGFRFVWSHKWVMAIIAQGAIQIGFVSAPITLIVPLWLSDQHASGQYGYAMAIEAVGALTATLLFTRGVRIPATLGMPVLVLQGAVLLVVICGAPTILIYPAYFVLGLAMGIFGTLWISALQATVPAELLGRVLSIDALGNSAFSLVGILITGLALGYLSFGEVSTASLAVLIASVVLAALVPGVLTLGRQHREHNIEP
ncbi:MFS transporter [Gordonia mangrovi]|uniref:MFS transporter n=1 Tax=Gordonia mangrovi TaxID=2665643 RepID=UPI0021AD3108|nr:MFS transporter [Gordonia mangrovi]UVF79125.1 MFS transporter [Gordonia mangrovi]